MAKSDLFLRLPQADPIHWRLIHAFYNSFFHRTEGSDIAHAIPGVGRAGWAADGFVAFQEARHEKLLRECGQLHTPPVAVIDDLLGVLRIDDTQYRARL